MQLDKINFKQLSKKQKILIPFIIIAASYVIWQVYDMLSGGSSAANTVNSSVSQKAVRNIAAQPSKIDAGTAGIVSKVDQDQQTSATPPQKSEISDLSNDAGQLQYVQMLNQYQLLKMKRMLLEEQVAIAAAKQKIADLNSKTNDLGGGDSDSDAMMDGNGDAADNGLQMLPLGKDGFKVVYIDRQNGEWNATLNHGGKFEEVTVGSELADGTQIISIDSSGVILKQGTKLNKVTFSGTNQVDFVPPKTNVESIVDTKSKKDEPAAPLSLQAKSVVAVEDKGLKSIDFKKKKINNPVNEEIKNNKEIKEVTAQKNIKEAPKQVAIEKQADVVLAKATVVPAKIAIAKIEKEVVKPKPAPAVNVATALPDVKILKAAVHPIQPQIVKIKIISGDLSANSKPVVNQLTKNIVPHVDAPVALVPSKQTLTISNKNIVAPQLDALKSSEAMQVNGGNKVTKDEQKDQKKIAEVVKDKKVDKSSVVVVHHVKYLEDPGPSKQKEDKSASLEKKNILPAEPEKVVPVAVTKTKVNEMEKNKAIPANPVQITIKSSVQKASLVEDKKPNVIDNSTNKEELKKLLGDLQKNTTLKQLKTTNENGQTHQDEKVKLVNKTADIHGGKEQDKNISQIVQKNTVHDSAQDVSATSSEPVVIIKSAKND